MKHYSPTRQGNLGVNLLTTGQTETPVKPAGRALTDWPGEGDGAFPESRIYQDDQIDPSYIPGTRSYFGCTRLSGRRQTT